MIAGTFQFEDLTIHFAFPSHRDGKVRVMVQNGQDGETANTEVEPRAFAASMALALDVDAMEHDSKLNESLYALCESIPFPNNNLRWIP